MESQSMDGEKFAFLRGLKQFLEDNRKVLVPYPRLAGKIIDLHELYNKVTSFGGYEKVNGKELWEDFLYDLKFPATSATLSFGLKSIYQRYLQDYERVHFLGEDENRKRSRYDTTINYTRNPQFIPEHDRIRHGLSLLRSNAGSGDYEKLSLSLLSCLPNEVDFAINACTLLSGESRHVLRLQNCPHILNTLLLHAGVIPDDKSEAASSSRIAFGWKESTKHDLFQFWHETVQNKTILNEILLVESAAMSNKRNLKDSECDLKLKCRKTTDISNVCSTSLSKEINTEEVFEHRDWSFLFQSKRSLGIEDHEGQRILQISLVLLNLSFEDFNVVLLAKSKSLVRFVMLCIHSNYSSLHQTGLDILSNISGKLHLLELGLSITELTYNVIKQSILSRDKFDQMRGFEILGKLCYNTDNQDSLIVAIDDHIVSSAIQVLLVGDVELTLAALESLYWLSKLGEEVCSMIMLVNGGIDILICLITFTVHSFGPGQLSKIRIAKRAMPQIPPVQRLQPYQQPVQYGQKQPAQSYHPQPYNAQQPLHYNPSYPTQNYQTRPQHPGAPVGYQINHNQNQPMHGYQPQPVHKQPVSQTQPQPVPQHLPHPQTYPRPQIHSTIPANPQHPQTPRGVQLRPQWGGPVYTHTETSTAPPVFHYMPAPPKDIVLDKSPRSFSKLWVWATYEPCENDQGSTPRVKVFAEYAAAASRYGMHSTNQVLPASEFGQCLQKVFPRTKSRLFKDSNGQPIYHITGIRKRQTPLPVPGHHPASVHSSSNQHPSTTLSGAGTPIIPPQPTKSVSNPQGGQKNENSIGNHNIKTEAAEVQKTQFPIVSNDQSAIFNSNQNSMEKDVKNETQTDNITNDISDDSKTKLLNNKTPVPVNHNHIDKVTTNVQNTLKLFPNSVKKVPLQYQNGILDPEEKMDTDNIIISPSKTNNVVTKKTLKNTVHCEGMDKNLVKENHVEKQLNSPNKNQLSNENILNTTLKTLQNGNGLSTEKAVEADKVKVAMVNGIIETSPLKISEKSESSNTKSSNPIPMVNGDSETSPTETPNKLQSPSSAQTLPITPNLLQNYYCVQKQKSTPAVEVINDKQSSSKQGDPHVNPAPLPHNLQTGNSNTDSLNANNFYNVSMSQKYTSTGVSAHVYPTPPVMLNSRLNFSPTETVKITPKVQSGPILNSESLVTTTTLPSQNNTSVPQVKVAPVTQTPFVAHAGQVSPPGSATKKKPNPIDLMAGNASLMVLHRNSGKQSFDDFLDEKEDPISRSIRLTAILILTNICKFSHEGKGLLKRHEQWLAYCCMSRMDASCMLAKLLAELNR